MNIHFQGTHFINSDKLTGKKGEAILFNTFNAGWRAAGTFDNVEITDLGPGETEKDKALKQTLTQFAQEQNIPIDTLYAFVPKSLPASNSALDANGQIDTTKSYHKVGEHWILVEGAAVPSDTMTVDEMADRIRPMHSRQTGSGYGGALYSLYDQLCQKLGLDNPFKDR